MNGEKNYQKKSILIEQQTRKNVFCGQKSFFVICQKIFGNKSSVYLRCFTKKEARKTKLRRKNIGKMTST